MAGTMVEQMAEMLAALLGQHSVGKMVVTRVGLMAARMAALKAVPKVD